MLMAAITVQKKLTEDKQKGKFLTCPFVIEGGFNVIRRYYENYNWSCIKKKRN